jgi:hypothetical protein
MDDHTLQEKLFNVCLLLGPPDGIVLVKFDLTGWVRGYPIDGPFPRKRLSSLLILEISVLDTNVPEMRPQTFDRIRGERGRPVDELDHALRKLDWPASVSRAMIRGLGDRTHRKPLCNSTISADRAACKGLLCASPVGRLDSLFCASHLGKGVPPCPLCASPVGRLGRGGRGG